MSKDTSLDPAKTSLAAARILVIRGQRVIADSQLAVLYGTTTKRLNEQVKRNIARFPADFMFKLTRVETASLNWSQVATTSQRHRRHNFAPYVFTEHGAIMAATVLNSPKAIEMSLYVVRAFVQLRMLLTSNAELARKLADVESRLEARLISHERAISEILSVLRHLTDSGSKRKRRGIGFTADIAD